MFIIFSGLPGTGKSTIGNRLADRLGAVYLRIDSIEQAVQESEILNGSADLGAVGYQVCYRVAADNLMTGRTVVADSVNPLKLTRDAYREVAQRVGVSFLEVEVMCSDPRQHRERIGTRQSTVAGLALPTWQQVVDRVYEHWDRPHLILDTAVMSVEQSIDTILSALSPYE
jgi:predicted kinase